MKTNNNLPGFRIGILRIDDTDILILFDATTEAEEYSYLYATHPINTPTGLEAITTNRVLPEKELCVPANTTIIISHDLKWLTLRSVQFSNPPLTKD